jgi:hypothetical protein
MVSTPDAQTPSPAPDLRAFYESTLQPYLAAQDSRVRATLRNRWLVLILGLAIAAAIFTWSWGGDSEFGPMAGFGLALVSIGYFWFAKAGLADDLRHELMGRIAKFLGLRYEPAAQGFDLEPFALLGLAGADKVKRSDRVFGEVGGLAVDMMAAKLADESSTGTGNQRHTKTTERFSGLLISVEDPAPPGVLFRLVPPAGAPTRNMLRGFSIVAHSQSADQPLPSAAELQARLAAGPEAAPPTPTGDSAFDARFELHATATDLPAALRRLDAATRAALLDIAAIFGGGPVSVGFDGGEILLAFVTEQRFEIGPLRPPMAEIGRVQHLADQMGILAVIAEKLRTGRESVAAD